MGNSKRKAAEPVSSADDDDYVPSIRGNKRLRKSTRVTSRTSWETGLEEDKTRANTKPACLATIRSLLDKIEEDAEATEARHARKFRRLEKENVEIVNGIREEAQGQVATLQDRVEEAQGQVATLQDRVKELQEWQDLHSTIGPKLTDDDIIRSWKKLESGIGQFVARQIAPLPRSFAMTWRSDLLCDLGEFSDHPGRHLCHPLLRSLFVEGLIWRLLCVEIFDKKSVIWSGGIARVFNDMCSQVRGESVMDRLLGQLADGVQTANPTRSLSTTTGDRTQQHSFPRSQLQIRLNCCASPTVSCKLSVA